MRFLTARPGFAGARVVIQGVRYDGGASWRRGAADGPPAIRAASDSIESYSPQLQRDLEDLDLTDVGDIALDGLRGPAMVERVAGATEILARRGARVLTLGGDHSVSIGTAAGLRAVHPELVHIVFDAHMDLRADYEGDRFSHACGTRRMAEAGKTVALGIRSGAREEFEDAERVLLAWSRELALPAKARRAIGRRAVFVSVDLDVLDPGVFPAVGNPEPAGATYQGLLDALLTLGSLDVVAVDILECAPRLDRSGASAVIAAELVRETILGVLSPSTA